MGTVPADSHPWQLMGGSLQCMACGEFIVEVENPTKCRAISMYAEDRVGEL